MKTQHTRLQHTTKYEQQLYKEWFSPIYTIDDCINRIPIADQSRCSVLQSRMSRYEGRFINLRLAFAIGSIWWSVWAGYYCIILYHVKQRLYHHYHSILRIFIWLVVSTPLKNISQIGNLPQIGVKIKNIRNHHIFIISLRFWCPTPTRFPPSRRSHRLEPNRGESRLHNSNLACRRGAWSH